MNTAFLSSDHRRAASIDLLETIRDGFILKMKMAAAMALAAKAAKDDEGFHANTHAAAAWKAAIDDVAWHIQREQGR